MTTVYIITQGDYSDYHIEAVCSSLDKCQEWMLNELKLDLARHKKWLENDEHYLSIPDIRERAKAMGYSNGYIPSTAPDDELKVQISNIKSDIQSIEKQIEKGSWLEETGHDEIYHMCEYRVEEYILDRIPEK